MLYNKLRRRAVFHLGRERRAYAFDPTDLVSEVYLRLARAELDVADQAHFLAVASRGMRQILVDHARKQLALKRIADDCLVELDETHCATDRSKDLVGLADALDELAKVHERKARVVALCYFGGLTHEEIAMTCGIHANTVSRDLHDSEAWLRRRLAT